MINQINKYRVWFRCWPDYFTRQRQEGLLVEAYTAIDADFQARVEIVEMFALAGHHIRSSDIVITRIAPESNDEMRLQTIETCARVCDAEATWFFAEADRLNKNEDATRLDARAGNASKNLALKIRALAREGKHDD